MNWNSALQAADSTESVIEVVNEFIARQSDRFWSRIPEPVRPDIVASTDEIHKQHHALVQALRRGRPSMELQELCVLFLQASVRVHQIELRENDASRPSNDDLGCASTMRPPKWFA